jgi:hypothetical protein
MRAGGSNTAEGAATLAGEDQPRGLGEKIDIDSQHHGEVDKGK